LSDFEIFLRPRRSFPEAEKGSSIFLHTFKKFLVKLQKLFKILHKILKILTKILTRFFEKFHLLKPDFTCFY